MTELLLDNHFREDRVQVRHRKKFKIDSEGGMSERRNPTPIPMKTGRSVKH